MAKAKVSNWKQKRQYIIQAPEKFEYQEIGITVASDPKLIPGRSIDVALSDLNNDRSKQQLRLVFEATEVAGDKVKTKFKKFSLTPGYIKSKIRKGMSKIDYVSAIELADAKVQVKMIIITSRRLTTPKRKDITALITSILSKHKKSRIDDFVQQVLFGKIGTEVYRKVKKITPVGRVEVSEVKKL